MARWNEKSRKRQATLISGWKPWLSSGVKTAEGKEKSKMNALKHGAYSAELEAMRAYLRECRKLLKATEHFRS